MSIFTETFQDFVFNQLRIREAALNQNSGRSLGTSKAILKDNTPQPLQAGAFVTNTVSKQCVIRMSSGVDLKEDNDLLEASDGNKDNLTGEGLAIRYMLEGGIPAKDVDFKNNRGNSQLKIIPRGRGTRQFTKGGGADYGSAYGDSYIRSDAKDDFGIVPMPGIIDAQIQTKTAYGSLRDAKINFVCHSRRQLDVLETLYMRPGMPILLEWGWDPYINNSGERTSYFPYLWEWFNKNESINNINKIIHDRINASGGNYDGFVGYVKNFEMKSRPDGGYDCTTELSAMGEVLEGLKGRNDGNTLKDKLGVDYEVDNLEYYLHALHFFCDWGERDIPTGGEGFEGGFSINKNTRNKEYDYITKIASNIIPLVDKKYKSPIDSEQPSNNTEDLNFKERNEPYIKVIQPDGYKNKGGKLDKYLIYKNEKLGVENDELDNTKSSYHYIRWDLLCMILNGEVLETYQQTTTTNEPITKISYRKELPVGGFNTNEYLKYSTFNFLQNTAEITRPSNNQTITINIPDLLDMSVNPEVCLLPHQIRGVKKDNDSSTDEGMVLTGDVADRNIGHIFIGLEHLIKLYEKLRYKGDEVVKDFSMFTFLQTLWEKNINNSCGDTHNFILSTEKTSGDTVRIIDMTKGPEHTLKPKDLYKFTIHGKGNGEDPFYSNRSVNPGYIPPSIVRDFNFNTSIDSKLSSTVAIAAQSPNSISDLDSVSFAAFNRNIQHRFFKETDEGVSPKVQERKANAYDKDLDDVKKMLAYLYDYRINMLRGDKGNPQSSTTALSFINNLESKIISLKSRYSETLTPIPGIYKGYFKKETNLSKSTVIPLKFNCQIDGIGGIVIGNVFKVDKRFLPKGYGGNDMAFAVLTENQTITSGQDWTTEFSGQMLLLDLGKKGPHDDIQIKVKTPTEKITGDYGTDDNYDASREQISPEQQNIDPNLSEIGLGDVVYLKLNDEPSKVRTGTVIDNGELSDNLIGSIPKGYKYLINRHEGYPGEKGLGIVLSRTILDPERFLNNSRAGESLSANTKEYIGYEEVKYEDTDFILINKKDSKGNDILIDRKYFTPGTQQYVNYGDGSPLVFSHTFSEDKYNNNKYAIPFGITYNFYDVREVTWYEIEFREGVIDYIRNNDWFNDDFLGGDDGNIGWMRIDTVQASPEFDPTPQN